MAQTRLKSALGLAAFVGLTGGTAYLASRSSKSLRRGGRSLWFRALSKPKFEPPRQAFAPIWTALYGTIALSGWRVWNTPSSPERTRALGLWAAQLGLNGMWTPLFFGRHRARLALADCAALAATVFAYRRAAKKVDKPAARLVTPYLGWATFATVLNAEVARRNPHLA